MRFFFFYRILCYYYFVHLNLELKVKSSTMCFYIRFYILKEILMRVTFTQLF